MKSDFALALNQIVAERNLPREMISQVLESALTATYRKNTNTLTSQNVEVKMDIEAGDVKVLVEKEVVESVFDARYEIVLSDARAQDPNVNEGDMLMVDVTAAEFNKIAAQNAKQMIVQKLREAERDFQFNQYSEREGELVTGMVQSVSASAIIISLGRAEGILTRKEQLPGEKFDQQQKIRAYVAEVKKSSRGMQILLSRTHKNMLRRLFEIEVPEVSDGKIEIRAISREAGSRSKVAVFAKEAGLDPVGACIGQRGSRIQTIVAELRNEKIDVIEFSDDPQIYIGKALGPAKVLTVFPNPKAGDGERESKTASVVVPDDQLSLAIGREGQNARLAAKLTGWRIDIRSGSEALGEALVKIAENDELKTHVGPAIVAAMPHMREMLVRQRAMPSALNADDFAVTKKTLESVREYDITHQPAKVADAAPDTNQSTASSKPAANIPAPLYDIPVDSLGLSPRVEQHLIEAGVINVGKLAEYGARGDQGLLAIEGIGAKAQLEVRIALDKHLAVYAPVPVVPEVVVPPPVVELPPAVESAVSTAGVTDPVAETAAPATDAAVEGDIDFEKYADSELDEDLDDEDRDAASIRRGGGVVAKAKGKVKGKDKKGRVLIFDETLGRAVVQRPRQGGLLDDIEE